MNDVNHDSDGGDDVITMHTTAFKLVIDRDLFTRHHGTHHIRPSFNSFVGERRLTLLSTRYQDGDHMLQAVSAWPYVRDAELLSVIDGDTLRLRIDLGWRVYIDGEIRLLGVNAPEMNTGAGKDARLFVVNLFNEVGMNMIVTSRHRDPDRSFARYLADVTLADGRDLSDIIIQAGHGVPYP